MNIAACFLLFVGVAALQCSPKTASKLMTPKENFTAIGKAENAKYSAVITTNEGEMYYIPQIASWSSAEHGRQIEVTGTLYERGQDPKPVNPKEPQSQEINAKFYTIEKASWKVID